ncbi:MAG: hypothetical protein IJ461_04045 [Clostridia bacterium]|nr:hypothetical protein [Clostridia bacterium]
MKKLIALVLALVLTLGCTAALAAGYGLGIATGIDSSTDATAEKDGNAQVDSTVCALVVDDEGKIVSCLFDVAQTKVSYSAAGLITADKTAEILSKQEKKEAYNMKPASPIGKEWYEQANALAEYCVGKTLTEVLANVTVDETGHCNAEDLKTSVTMSTGDFMVALEKAYTQATAK